MTTTDLDSAAHVAVDWGTTRFRLWVLDGSGRVLAERRSGEGLAVAGAAGFEAVLEAHLAALGLPEDLPVMLCGMVGSRGGWVEAAYLQTPIHLDYLVARTTPVPGARRPVRILPGIAQRDIHEPDVLRGEETQLLALSEVGPDSGLACLPGTHSKWVRLAQGRVQGFATFMTGELFQLLRSQSVLAPALEGAGAVAPDSAGFQAGVEAALQAPALVGHSLFALRAAWLLEGGPAEERLARLSGLLIGLELAGAAERYGRLAEVVLIAAEPAAGLYARALQLAGVARVIRLDAEDCVRRGLHRAALASFSTAGDVPA